MKYSSSFIITLAFGSLYAAEGDTRQFTHELRVGFDSLPTSYNAHLDNKTSGISVDDSGNADTAGQINAGYQVGIYPSKSSPAGAIIGLGFSGIAVKDQSNGETDKVSSFGPYGDFGLSYLVTDNFKLEGFIRASAGFSRFTMDGIRPVTISSKSGSYTEIGLMIRPVYKLDIGLTIFLEAGYIDVKQSASFDRDAVNNIGQLEITDELKGGVWGFGGGWQF